jgi:hypothetical protein
MCLPVSGHVCEGCRIAERPGFFEMDLTVDRYFLRCCPRGGSRLPTRSTATGGPLHVAFVAPIRAAWTDAYWFAWLIALGAVFAVLGPPIAGTIFGINLYLTYAYCGRNFNDAFSATA